MSPKSPNRDQRTAKTPPGGVASQLAPEKYDQRAASQTDEDWSGDTGSVSLHHDGDTPVGLETEDAAAETRLRHRVKQTAATTQAIKETVETTHVGIDTLRLEHKRAISTLDGRIGVVSSEVSSVKAKVEQVAADQTGIKAELKANTEITKFVASQLPVVISALTVDRKLTQEEDHFVRRKIVETKAHEAQARIDEGANKRQWWRDISLKVVGAALGLLGSGAVIGYLVTHVSSC